MIDALRGTLLLMLGVIIGMLSTATFYSYTHFGCDHSRESLARKVRIGGSFVPLPTSPPVTPTSPQSSVRNNVDSFASAREQTIDDDVDDDRRGFLCGDVEQEPFFVVQDEYNNESRIYTRQTHVWHMNRGILSQAWQDLWHSMKDGDFKFGNMGVMHAADNFTSNATYYCGLLPHNVLPWSVTFRSYRQWDVMARRGDFNGGRRLSRYSAADVAIGVYTGARFLRTRASAARDTYLSRHPANRVFFFVGEGDGLDLFHAMRAEGAGEDYSSALVKQMYALKHMWAKAADAKWFLVIGSVAMLLPCC
jgi:hypothetical protein